MVRRLYRPSEEHEAFRAVVRELCEEKVAPNAAEADELAEFPKASFEALVAADFHAPHIPEEYSGVGADALATAIVIEEVARACAATSLVPAVNKLAIAMADRWIRRNQTGLLTTSRARRIDGVLSLVRAGVWFRRSKYADLGCTRRRLLRPERRQTLDHQCRAFGLLHSVCGDRSRRSLQGHQLS